MGLGTGCIVTVCRGCCCGTADKHPDVDSAAHLARLKEIDGAFVRVSDCLLACELSNMVVVNPSRAGRAAGGRPAWLGGVLTDDDVEVVAGWVEAGGPGVAPMPLALLGKNDAVKELQERLASG